MDENTTPDSTEPTTEPTTAAAPAAESEDMGKKIMDGAKDLFGNIKEAAVDAAEKVVKKDLDGDGKIGG